MPPLSWQALSREWLEFEGDVISALFQLNRHCRVDGDHAMKPDTTKAPAEDRSIFVTMP
jgi:hypothetical protein